MLLQQSAYSNITGTGSQVTPGLPHSQICLRVASPKVREHSHTTPIAYELASDTYYGLGVVTTWFWVIWMIQGCEGVGDIPGVRGGSGGL